MTKDTTTKSDVPQDRLTRIGDAMLGTFHAHAEKHEPDRVIVFLNDDKTRGGIALAGYDNDVDAIADLVIHLRALFRARGQDLHLVPVGTTPPKDRA